MAGGGPRVARSMDEGDYREVARMVGTFIHPEPTVNITTLLGSIEATAIRMMLARTGGNQGKAAKLLGLKRATLQYRMWKHGILPPVTKRGPRLSLPPRVPVGLKLIGRPTKPPTVPPPLQSFPVRPPGECRVCGRSIRPHVRRQDVCSTCLGARAEFFRKRI